MDAQEERSYSVNELVKAFTSETSVSAVQIVNALFKSHTDYADSRAPKFQFQQVASDDFMSVEEWIQATRPLLNPDVKSRLNGRLLIILLSIEVPRVGTLLLKEELLADIVTEYENDRKKRLKEVLTSDANERLDQLLYGVSDSVPLHDDNAATFDKLGRKPFANVLAMRIEEAWSTLEKQRREKEENHKKQGKKRTEYGEAFMVHIHGRWGSGKSSVLNFLGDQLVSKEKDNKWVVINFNAWAHQRLSPPWWILIRIIYRQSVEQLSRDGFWSAFPLRIKWFWWRLRADWLPGVLALLLILLAIAFATGLFDFVSSPELLAEGDQGDGVQSSGSVATDSTGGGNGDNTGSNNVEHGINLVTAAAAALGAIYSASRSLLFGSARAAKNYVELRGDPMRPILRLFQKLVSGIGRPVAVFVDDLDRCDSDYLVELLEGIQTLFKESLVIYVVAADRNWIRSSFEQKYKNFSESVSEPGQSLGYLFLEKIFQVSAAIPRVSGEVLQEFWESLLRKSNENSDELLLQEITEAEKLAEEILSGKYKEEDFKESINSYDGDLRTKQALRALAAKKITEVENRKTVAHSLKSFAEYVEGNPRAMKRLVNAYGMSQAVNFIAGRNVDRENLALWTIIELRWPLLADAILDNPKIIDYMTNESLPHDVDMPKAIKELIRNKDVSSVMTRLKNQVPSDNFEELLGFEDGHLHSYEGVR